MFSRECYKGFMSVLNSYYGVTHFVRTDEKEEGRVLVIHILRTYIDDPFMQMKTFSSELGGMGFHSGISW